MKRIFAVLIAVTSAFAPTMADAAGFRISEQGNMAQGMSHAVTASVDDASAVYYNPAAMVDVGEYAASGGVQAIHPTTSYDGQGVTELKTSNITFAVPSVYVVKTLSDNDMAVGLGVFSNFGLGTTWSNSGPFKYVATETKLTTATVSANFAKRLGDDLSVAVGVNYMSSTVKFNSMYPFAFFVPGSADGIQAVNGEGDGFGFNAAVLYKATDQLKIGLSYRSAISTTISGDIEIDNFPGALQPLSGGAVYSSDAEVDMEFPAIATLGLAFQATESLLLEFDADYTGWSSYDELNFKFDSPLTLPNGVAMLPSESTQTKDYEDVIAYRFGAAYKHDDKLTIRVGGYFDPTPIPAETVDPRLPSTDLIAYTLGFTYQATDNFHVDASAAYLTSDTLTIDNDIGAEVFSSVDGEYSSTAEIYGVSVGYKF